MTRYAVTPPPLDLFVGPLRPQQAANSSAIGTANLCVWTRFQVTRPVTVSLVRYNAVVAAGNMDVAITDASFNVLASTGSFAMPGTGARSQALTASVRLVPGRVYHAAVSFSDATAAIARANGTSVGSSAPMSVSATSSFPVPAAASPSTAHLFVPCLVFE